MSEFSVCVDIVHTETKVGDTLCALPLIMQMADEYAIPIHVMGAFAESVKPLLRRLPIRFATPDCSTAVQVQVDVHAAYQQGRALNQHMAAAICQLADWPLPTLPITFDLASVSVGLPSGIVISPFSGSGNPWYKVWPFDRWLKVVHHLLSRNEKVYVVAASGENVAPFVHAGAIPLVGLSLPEILHVMQSAKLFASIDNGLSHLAHFGNVQRHLLLYPELLPPNLVMNPRARVLRGRPEQIQVDTVIAHMHSMLQPVAATA